MKIALLFCIASCCVAEDNATIVSGATSNATLAAGGTSSCSICEALVKKLTKEVAKAGCVAIDAAGVTTCEAVGLGPEDPFADICAAAVVTLCPIVASKVAKHTAVDPKKTCDQAHLCGLLKRAVTARFKARRGAIRTSNAMLLAAPSTLARAPSASAPSP